MKRTIKKLINRQKAKIEHKRRLQDQHWITHFYETVELIKVRNKQILLNQLIEVTNTSPTDMVKILSLDKMIEDNKKAGVITELYTRPEED